MGRSVEGSGWRVAAGAFARRGALECGSPLPLCGGRRSRGGMFCVGRRPAHRVAPLLPKRQRTGAVQKRRASGRMPVSDAPLRPATRHATPPGRRGRRRSTRTTPLATRHAHPGLRRRVGPIANFYLRVARLPTPVKRRRSRQRRRAHRATAPRRAVVAGSGTGTISNPPGEP
jgi:hypothetical protein